MCSQLQIQGPEACDRFMALRSLAKKSVLCVGSKSSGGAIWLLVSVAVSFGSWRVSRFHLALGECRGFIWLLASVAVSFGSCPAARFLKMHVLWSGQGPKRHAQFEVKFH